MRTCVRRFVLSASHKRQARSSSGAGQRRSSSSTSTSSPPSPSPSHGLNETYVCTHMCVRGTHKTGINSVSFAHRAHTNGLRHCCCISLYFPNSALRIWMNFSTAELQVETEKDDSNDLCLPSLYPLLLPYSLLLSSVDSQSQTKFFFRVRFNVQLSVCLRTPCVRFASVSVRNLQN